MKHLWHSHHPFRIFWFSTRILESFSDETAVIGLADSYKNWAGHARIVIPFAPEKMHDIQAAAKDGKKQSAKIDSKNKAAQKNSETEKEAAQNKKESAGKSAAQNDADKRAKQNFKRGAL